MCGINKESLRRYHEDFVKPKLQVFPEFGNIPETTENKQVASQKSNDFLEISKQVQTSVANANAIGRVQRAVISLRKRAEGVLTRVESRPDDQFSGREWASVATVAARMMETQARMNGELNDHKGPGDVNIQINMPASSRRSDAAPIDVDVVRTIKSES